MKKYQKILREITEKHALTPSPMENIKSIAVFDADQSDFFLIDVDQKNKEHYVVFHLSLQNEKVLIEQDGIEYGIANDLIEAGISSEDIVGIPDNIKTDGELLAA